MTRQRRGSNHRGVGVAHWRRKQVLKVPAEVLHLWFCQMALGRHNDLLEIKRSSPLVILGKLFQRYSGVDVAPLR